MSVKISGNAISLVGKVKSNLTPASTQQFIRKAVNYQVFSTKQNFTKESDPDGNKWKPLKARTLKRKRSGKILRETSRLINSIEPQVLKARGIVRATTGYGIFHQTGTRKMAKRQFLGISKIDEEKIIKIAESIFLDDF